MDLTNLASLNPLHDDIRSKDAYAVFTPAISPVYVNALQMADSAIRNGNLPSVLGGSAQSLNFLNPRSSLFHYGWGLYSAGHAVMDRGKIDAGADAMVQRRDRTKTRIVGDSGGYQIATGQWKIDLDDRRAVDARCEHVLNWQAETADVIMALDFPPAAMAEAVKRDDRSAAEEFRKCLSGTIANHEVFEANIGTANRKPILNVIHGQTISQQKEWYEAVRRFNFQGWAFPFRQHGSVQRLLLHLVDMLHDGALNDCQWIHFLGLSRLRFAGALTILMRALRERVNPELILSFDASTPMLVGGKVGDAYHHWRFGLRGKQTDVALEMRRVPRDFSSVGSQAPFPFISSPIARGLRMGDICINAKRTKENSSWDTLSATLIAAHNTYVHIAALMEMNRLMDCARSGAWPIELPFQYGKFEDCVNKAFSRKATRAQAKSIVYDHPDVLQFFDRDRTVYMAELMQGGIGDWGRCDLEEFAMHRELPPIIVPA